MYLYYNFIKEVSEFIGRGNMCPLLYTDEIETTKDIKIPKDPMSRVIGQGLVIEKVKIAAMQRRHLLLVGPPGVGKSMIAQALALHLPKPNEEVRILHNPQNPERPSIEIITQNTEKGNDYGVVGGEILAPKDVPSFVAEQLGFRCHGCGAISGYREVICYKCGNNKYNKTLWNRRRSPFSDIITEVFEVSGGRPEREVHTTAVSKEGKDEIIIYQRVGDEKIMVLKKGVLEDIRKNNERKQQRVLLPLNRIPFVHATGASETELLGDVRHDPYGSHPDIGTPAYLRVILGAIHEAHEGVLFIDELPHMQYLQNFILTAMQEKKFSVVGRNPYSAGASVKVSDVPCDFIFVGACNIIDVSKILPALRSRINGNGYEILLETTMPDTEENRGKLTQFVAQEIESDGRIPHARNGAIEEIIKEAKKRALSIDGVRNALTLRLRDLGGLIRLAGDRAFLNGSEFIEKDHIRKSVADTKPIEYQLKDRYGSIWRGVEKDSNIGLGSLDDEKGYA